MEPTPNNEPVTAKASDVENPKVQKLLSEIHQRIKEKCQGYVFSENKITVKLLFESSHE
jgi:hypothetical protein